MRMICVYGSIGTPADPLRAPTSKRFMLLSSETNFPAQINANRLSPGYVKTSSQDMSVLLLNRIELAGKCSLNTKCKLGVAEIDVNKR